MKLKNKIFLSLGTTAAVIAPITTAVACGDIKEVSQTAIEQRELWAKSQNLIETKYQEMLISEISKNANHQLFGKDIKEEDLQDYSTLSKEMKDAILAVIKRNIYITPTYLTTFAEKLLHTADPNGHKYKTLADYTVAINSILKTSVGNFNAIIDSVTQSSIAEINKIAESLGKGTIPGNATMPTALTSTADKAAIDKFINDVKGIFKTDAELAANTNSMNIDTTAKLDSEFAKYKYSDLPAKLADTATKTDIDKFITYLEGKFANDQEIFDNLATHGIKTQDELKNHLEDLTKDAANAVKAFKESLDETKTTGITKFDWTDIQTTISALIALVTDDAGAQAISKSDTPFTFKDLTDDGFYDYYLQNTDVTKVKATNDKIEALVTKYISVIWKNNIANFKNVFYQYVISSLYLDTNKTNWQAVFYDVANATGKINGLEGNLKADHFVLGQKLLRNKLAYDWNITLDDQASKAYAGVEKTETELDESLSSTKTTGDIYKDATTTQRRSLLPSFVWDEKATTGVWTLVSQSKDLIGFNGLVEKSGFASTDSKIKQVIDTKQYDVNYEGYVNKEKTGEVIDESSTVNNVVKLTTPSNSKVDVEKIIMLMPTYVNGELSLDFLMDAKGGDGFTTLRDIMISKQGSDIYKEAIEYYSSKDNKEFTYDNDTVKGIRLTILDESLRKVATDTFGLSYVNKD